MNFVQTLYSWCNLACLYSNTKILYLILLYSVSIKNPFIFYKFNSCSWQARRYLRRTEILQQVRILNRPIFFYSIRCAHVKTVAQTKCACASVKIRTKFLRMDAYCDESNYKLVFPLSHYYTNQSLFLLTANQIKVCSWPSVRWWWLGEISTTQPPCIPLMFHVQNNIVKRCFSSLVLMRGLCTAFLISTVQWTWWQRQWTPTTLKYGDINHERSKGFFNLKLSCLNQLFPLHLNTYVMRSTAIRNVLILSVRGSSLYVRIWRPQTSDYDV